jgi:hypothetical protein
VRVNPRIIPAVGGDGEVHSYSFVDDGVRPQRTYYYYLDAVEGSGIKQRFTEGQGAPGRAAAVRPTGAMTFAAVLSMGRRASRAGPPARRAVRRSSWSPSTP